MTLLSKVPRRRRNKTTIELRIWKLKEKDEYKHQYMIGAQNEDGEALDISFFVTVMGRKEHIPLFEKLLGIEKKPMDFKDIVGLMSESTPINWDEFEKSLSVFREGLIENPEPVKRMYDSLSETKTDDKLNFIDPKGTVKGGEKLELTVKEAKE